VHVPTRVELSACCLMVALNSYMTDVRAYASIWSEMQKDVCLLRDRKAHKSYNCILNLVSVSNMHIASIVYRIKSKNSAVFGECIYALLVIKSNFIARSDLILFRL
jgi:hypothetical protein